MCIRDRHNIVVGDIYKMVGWISLVAVIGFTIFFVKFSIELVTDTLENSTSGGLMAMFLFILGLIYLGSDIMLSIVVVGFVIIFIKQRIL